VSVTAAVDAVHEPGGRPGSLPGAAGIGDDNRGGQEDGAARLVGRLVHRLLRRHPPGRLVDPGLVAADALRLVTDEERGGIEAVERVVDEAARLHQRLVAQPGLAALFADGAVAWEVPCSTVGGDRVVRGTIDCLIRRPDGSLVVVEIKSGLASPAHERQLALYVAAVRALAPGTPVTGLLVHP
jgi:hypothetical protein